jgi:hypothetical protein
VMRISMRTEAIYGHLCVKFAFEFQRTPPAAIG